MPKHLVPIHKNAHKGEPHTDNTLSKLPSNKEKNTYSLIN